jgi:hypothetical protein
MYHTTVKATDSHGVSGSVSFTWAVRSGTGPVKGYGSKCLDDYQGRTLNGNKIDIYTCTGGSPQTLVTAQSNPDGVAVDGSHIYWADFGDGAIHEAKLDGTSPQRLTFLANGELTVLGKCLRDSGGRVILYTCNTATTEQWTRHSNGE